MSYRYINHTADLGIEVRGKTLKELFINTARAIFETQLKGEILSTERLKIEITSPSLEELIVEWCRELLYNFAVKGFIPKDYKIKITKDHHLAAHLEGDRFDSKRHKIKLEIKNPTYHNLSIKKLARDYLATIIFDV